MQDSFRYGDSADYNIGVLSTRAELRERGATEAGRIINENTD